MVVSEKDVCIEEFIGSHEGFSGVVKQRYRDFIVHEVRMDGSLVKLDSYDLPKEEETSTPSKEVAWELFQELFSENSLVDDLRKVLEGDIDQSINLPAGDDKERRKRIHDALKAFPDVDTETIVGKDSSKVIVVKKSTGKRGSGPRKRRRTQEIPPSAYTTFVLYKENLDTNDVLSRMGSMLKIHVKKFFFAGTKDKRAVTTQDVSVRGIGPQRLFQLSKGLRGIALGNFRPDTKEPLRLGQLAGNHFTILLRDLDSSATPESVHRAVTSVKTHGFINFFGLQRFGLGSNPTHKVGLELLQGNIKRAVERILEPLDPTKDKPGAVLHESRKKTIKALQGFLEGNVTAGEALRDIPPKMSVERAILTSYARAGSEKDHQRAYNSLPYTLRTMYIHAVQSYLWNAMATTRVRTGSTEFAEEGDIILDLNEREAKEAESEGENRVVPVRYVTAEEAEQRKFPAFLIQLPMIGEAVKLPLGETGRMIRAKLEELQLDLHSPLEKKLGLRLYGSYRRLLALPKRVDYRIIPYAFDTQDILVTDHDEMRGMKEEAGGEGALRGLKLEFQLEAAEYATMLLRELTKQDSSVLGQKRVHEDFVNSSLKTGDTEFDAEEAQPVN